MRRFALLLLALTGCGAVAEKPVFFDETAGGPPVECSGVPALDARASAVADVVQVADSFIAVLLPNEGEIVRFDNAFRPVATVSFDRRGPRGVGQAGSVAVLNDAYYIADVAGLAIKILSSSGKDRGAVRLGFVPYRVRVAGSNVYVTPMVFGGNPSTLLVALKGDKAESLEVPIARYEDLGIGSFANLGSLAAFPDGRVVVMHEFVVPFGYSRFERDGQSFMRRFAVPLPDAVRSRVDRLPTPPITESNIGDVLAVALTATANPKTGGLFYLTRTGRRISGQWEKMVVEVDSAFQHVRSFRAPGFPQHMVFFAARSSILLVGDEGQWHECKLS